MRARIGCYRPLVDRKLLQHRGRSLAGVSPGGARICQKRGPEPLFVLRWSRIKKTRRPSPPSSAGRVRSVRGVSRNSFHARAQSSAGPWLLVSARRTPARTKTSTVCNVGTGWRGSSSRSTSSSPVKRIQGEGPRIAARPPQATAPSPPPYLSTCAWIFQGFTRAGRLGQQAARRDVPSVLMRTTQAASSAARVAVLGWGRAVQASARGAACCIRPLPPRASSAARKPVRSAMPQPARPSNSSRRHVVCWFFICARYRLCRCCVRRSQCAVCRMPNFRLHQLRRDVPFFRALTS